MITKNERQRFNRSSAIGAGLGVAGGVLLGLLMNNLGVGIPVGLVIGAGAGSTGIFVQKRKDEDPSG